MVDWYLLLVPLTLVPVILLLGFVGCELDKWGDGLFAESTMLKVFYGGTGFGEPVPQHGLQYPFGIRLEVAFDSGKVKEEFQELEWAEDGTLAAGDIYVFWDWDAGVPVGGVVELRRLPGTGPHAELSFPLEPDGLWDTKFILYCLTYRLQKNAPPPPPDDYNVDDFQLMNCQGVHLETATN